MKLLTTLFLALSLSGAAQDVSWDLASESFVPPVLSPCTGMTWLGSSLGADDTPMVMGTAMAFQGVSVCAYQGAVTTGWPAIQDDSHAILVGIVSVEAVRLDSLVIVYEGTGQLRVLVDSSSSSTYPPYEIYNGPATGNTHIYPGDCLESNIEWAGTSAIIHIKPYMMTDLAFVLKSVHAYVSPCDISTGVRERSPMYAKYGSVYFDLIGRAFVPDLTRNAFIFGTR